MRVDADGRVDRFVAVGQTDAGFEVRRTIACADHHHAIDAGRQGAIDHGLAVGVELGVIEMAVTIDHLSRASLQTSSDGDVFEKTGEDGVAAFKRRSHDHAL